MLDQRYAYFFGSTLFLIIWLILYINRKDTKTEMLAVSAFVAVGSLVTAYLFWTVDWWRPLTITNTRVGIEDLILGFANGGIAAVIYEEVFRRRLYKREKKRHNFGYILLLVIAFMTTSYLFWGFGISSFISSALASLILGVCVLYFRPDLLVQAVLGGGIDGRSLNSDLLFCNNSITGYDRKDMDVSKP